MNMAAKKQMALTPDQLIFKPIQESQRQHMTEVFLAIPNFNAVDFVLPQVARNACSGILQRMGNDFEQLLMPCNLPAGKPCVIGEFPHRENEGVRRGKVHLMPGIRWKPVSLPTSFNSWT